HPSRSVAPRGRGGDSAFARRARAARGAQGEPQSAARARGSPVRATRRGEGSRRRPAGSEIDSPRACLTARVVFWDSTGAVRPPWRLLVFGVASVASLIILNGAVVQLVSGALALVGVRVVLFPWVLLASTVLGHAITFRLVDPRG